MTSLTYQDSPWTGLIEAFFLWIVLVFLAVEFYLPYFDVGPVPLPNYFLLLFAFAGLIFVVGGQAKIKRMYLLSFPPFLLAVAFLSIALSSFTAGISLVDWAKALSTKILVPLFLFVVTYYLIRFLGVDTFIKILAGIAGLSGLVAIGQGLGIDFFWHVRTIFGAEGQSEIADQFYARPTGLSFYAIELCYQLVLILPLACYLYGKYKRFRYALLVMFIIGGILATKTYSAILALLSMGVLYVLQKKKYLLFSIICCLAFGAIVSVLSSDFLLSKIMRESTYARLPEAVLATEVILHNPLGIGYENYQEYAQAHFDSIMGMKGYKVALHHAAHNQILNSGIYYGWVVMILTLYFYGRYIKGLWGRQASLLHALFLAHVGYLVNSLFHNNGVIMGDRIYWHVIALTEFLLISSRVENVSTSD